MEGPLGRPSAMQKPWLVQDACWADLNGDGKVELLIAVEWGSMKVFHQTQEGCKTLERQQWPGFTERMVESRQRDRLGW